MAQRYEELKYSRTQVKRAGKTYISDDATKQQKEDALVMINNWRAAHSFPMQVLYVHVKKVAPENAIVAQRLKRLYSITQKLYRFPNMSLTTMQDIGGCRVIVDTIDQVYQMAERLQKSRMRHGRKEHYDYLKNPKPDGYRSFHSVFSYFSEKNPQYNGLFIEVQIRTHIQHLWATAVEMMDTFTGDPLKIGHGSPENRQFFIYASELLRIYEESGYSLDAVNQSPVKKSLIEYDSNHNILNRLNTIKEAVGFVRQADAKGQGYYLLRLNIESGQLLINQYTQKQLEEATAAYDAAEKNRESNEDVVLVATTSFNALKQAYPNYFSDISEFIKLMHQFLEY